MDDLHLRCVFVCVCACERACVSVRNCMNGLSLAVAVCFLCVRRQARITVALCRCCKYVFIGVFVDMSVWMFWLHTRTKEGVYVLAVLYAHVHLLSRLLLASLLPVCPLFLCAACWP